MLSPSRITIASLLFVAPSLLFATPDFDTQIRPILEENCIRCHGAGKRKGGLGLHTFDAVVAGGDSGTALVPGRPEDSELIFRVCLPPEHDEVMPQESSGLSRMQIETLKNWILSGASWPDGLVLRPSEKSETDPLESLRSLPPPSSMAEAAAQLDSILAEETEIRFPEVQENPKGIDDLAFLRRATIDLIGRIPTYAEIQEFKSWEEQTRRSNLISRLVSNPRFNDRWAVFFSDLLRVRTSSPGGRQLLAYLHRSVEENKPYDSLVRELISATGKPGSNPAVGYILADEADPMTLAGATSQIFLGVRIACAECHDHPFDDWNQRQFYELAAFFGKTKTIENRFANTLYAIDGEEMSVRWPPEREEPTSRQPVDPLFPFRPSQGSGVSHHLERFRKLRGETDLANRTSEPSIDELVDRESIRLANGFDELPDIATDVRRESSELHQASVLESTSILRERLAGLITDPGNAFFARAFVNRVWFELNGRGFVEPLDNFSSYREISHPATLEYIAREFIASGFDLRSLVTMISLTDCYARAGTEAEAPDPERNELERAFIVAPARRMLSEVLFDSILVAGHLFEKKWPDGANIRTRQRQVRVPIMDSASGNDSTPPPPMKKESAESIAGYSLEDSIEIDFASALSGSMSNSEELGEMRAAADRQLDREAREKEMRAQSANRVTRYRLEVLEESIDDNPVFASTMRMATPAPPAHFLRVFGQPSREGLGEFRDHSSSLRQQLMMLNGRVTHEAARVGTLEPLHTMINDASRHLSESVRYVYLETLTREPSKLELAEALEVLSGSTSPSEGMEDLRWALLNCHEFRFSP